MMLFVHNRVRKTNILQANQNTFAQLREAVFAQRHTLVNIPNRAFNIFAIIYHLCILSVEETKGEGGGGGPTGLQTGLHRLL